MDNTQKNQPIQNVLQPQDKSTQDDLQSHQQSPVTVPVGGAEGAPARVENQIQSVENFVQNSEVEPEVSPEVQPYVQPTPQPRIKSDAIKAGVQESIPHGPNYAIPPIDIKEGEKIVKESKSTSDANIWRVLVSVLNEKRKIFKGLFGKKPIQNELA